MPNDENLLDIIWQKPSAKLPPFNLSLNKSKGVLFHFIFTSSKKNAFRIATDITKSG